MPANETQSPARGCVKLAGLTGTGLAQPTWATNIKRVPSGSKCLSGLSVTRPAHFAVVSPNCRAVQAWANSWRVRAKRNTGRKGKRNCRSKCIVLSLRAWRVTTSVDGRATLLATDQMRAHAYSLLACRHRHYTGQQAHAHPAQPRRGVSATCATSM